MKQLSVISVVLIASSLFLWGCGSRSASNTSKSNTQCETVTYDHQLAISHSGNESRELVEGFEYGFIENGSADYDEIEKKMLSYNKDYMIAMKNANPSVVKQYIDKQAIKYYERLAKANGESIDFTLDEFVEMTCDEFRQFNKQAIKQNIIVDYSFARLVRRVNSGDNIFIVLDNAINMTTPEKVKIHMSPLDRIVGISNDKGNNRVFIGLNESFPLIYDGIYSEEEIDAVMGY